MTDPLFDTERRVQATCAPFDRCDASAYNQRARLNIAYSTPHTTATMPIRT